MFKAVKRDLDRHLLELGLEPEQGDVGLERAHRGRAWTRRRRWSGPCCWRWGRSPRPWRRARSAGSSRSRPPCTTGRTRRSGPGTGGPWTAPRAGRPARSRRGGHVHLEVLDQDHQVAPLVGGELGGHGRLLDPDRRDLRVVRRPGLVDVLEEGREVDVLADRHPLLGGAPGWTALVTIITLSTPRTSSPCRSPATTFERTEPRWTSAETPDVGHGQARRLGHVGADGVGERLVADLAGDQGVLRASTGATGR